MLNTIGTMVVHHLSSQLELRSSAQVLVEQDWTERLARANLTVYSANNVVLIVHTMSRVPLSQSTLWVKFMMAGLMFSTKVVSIPLNPLVTTICSSEAL